MKRIGLLGGAFNPPHLGHLRLAQLGWDHLTLDELRFVPTARSPHKATEGPDGTRRLHLLRIALQGSPFGIETLELDRGGTSYTVDSLEALSEREPEAGWILLMGADQAETLPAWRNIPRIWELASIAVAPRPGGGAWSPGAWPERRRQAWSGAPGELVALPGSDLDLASSALREALRRGEEPQGLQPQVLAAIRLENLYR
ncbi:MAG: nicotinate (nicotinamide) nucleotide adenylyltransferase [Acidobacteria bacterium]|nr:nicotinate (nicotinamide) nucleotide adenylyltransferase [Acidobacteriota bacterium]